MTQNGTIRSITQKLGFGRLLQACAAFACALAVGMHTAQAQAKKAPEDKAKIVISSGSVTPSQGVAGDTFRFAATLTAKSQVKGVDVNLRIVASDKIKTSARTLSGIAFKSGESQTFTVDFATPNWASTTYSLYVVVTDPAKSGAVIVEGAAATITVVAPQPTPQPTPVPTATPAPTPTPIPPQGPTPFPAPTSPKWMSLLGITLSGGERSGAEFSYPGEAHLDYYNNFGINLVRIPFKWERLQPTLMGPLDPAEVAKLREVVRNADIRGINVFLVAYNMGKYNGKTLGTSELPAAALTDLWRRIAIEFRDGSFNIMGYQIMAKPEVLQGTWPVIAQEAVYAIRESDIYRMILVDGECGSSAHTWVQCNPNLDIIDTGWGRRLAYSAVQFVDSDMSGSYVGTYDQEQVYGEKAVDLTKDFIQWSQAKGARPIIAEFAVPWDDKRYAIVLNNLLEASRYQCVTTFLHYGGQNTTYEKLSVDPFQNDPLQPSNDKPVLRFLPDITMFDDCRERF